MSRLNLDKAPVIDSGTESEITQSAEEILRDVAERTAELGLLPYPKPDTAPQTLVGVDIETLPNSALGNLYVQYVAYAQFVRGELANLEAAYRIATSNLKKIDARLRSELFTKSVAKAEVASRVKDDALYIEYDHEVVKLFAMKSIIEAHYKAYDSQASALSRIISLRELEFEQSTRESSIGNIRSRKDKAQRPLQDFSGRSTRGRSSDE